MDDTMKNVLKATTDDDVEAREKVEEASEAYRMDKAAMRCTLARIEKWFEERANIAQAKAKRVALKEKKLEMEESRMRRRRRRRESMRKRQRR